jgi:DNA repair exonuclease SbcCD ATPase subunit
LIKFKTIRYKNFLSTGDNWTELQLNASNHTLIVGQNGSGKSTMLDAISYALFGKSHRSINKAQLINSVNQKAMRVEVEFSIGNKNYKIVRGLKPVKFEIYVDGNLLNQNSHNKEYQKILEQNILKLNHKTFHQVVVLGSSSFIPFMQLSAFNRREVIEDLLDINVFSKMNALLKEKNATLREKINQTLHAIEINETKTEAQKKYIRDISKIKHDEKKKFEEQIKQKRDLIDELQKDNTEKRKHLQKFGDEYKAEYDAARNFVKELESANTEILTKVNTLVQETKFYEKNESCPTCEQEIDEQLKRDKLKQAKVAASEFQSSLAEITKKKSEAENGLEHWSEKINELTEISHKMVDNDENIERIKFDIECLEVDIEDLNDEKSDLAKANDDYDALVKEYHELIGQKSKQNDQAAYNTVISEMLKDTGIKTKIIKQYLPVINKLVNQYLSILDFYVHFDLNESFAETIKSRHRDSFSYDSFSEGEKQRIDLALLFTWRQVAKMKNSISTNLLILDETFDSSLDESGIENLMKIIHTLGDDTNVFIISHKGDILDGKFDSKIEFVKDKNFSKIKK